MTTRVIIAATDNDARWSNYRDTPKHLVKIEKEVLLERTCKQFLKYTDDVRVVGLDERYKVEGTSLYVVRTQNTHWGDVSKFLSSQNLWNTQGRTVIVFGDVYFTNDAVKKIMSDKSEFKFFLRKGPSSVSGARWKEIFAFSFNHSAINHVVRKLMLIISRGQVSRQAGWSLYAELVGPYPAGDMFNNSHYVEIDDWTEDFDFPEDLEIWEQHRKDKKKKTSDKSTA